MKHKEYFFCLDQGYKGNSIIRSVHLALDSFTVIKSIFLGNSKKCMFTEERNLKKGQYFSIPMK